MKQLFELFVFFSRHFCRNLLRLLSVCSFVLTTVVTGGAKSSLRCNAGDTFVRCSN